MKKLFFIIFIIAIAISCTETRRIRKVMQTFTSKVVELPSELLLIDDNNVVPFEPCMDKMYYVRYFGPYECTSCALSHLSKETALFDLCDSIGNVSPLIVFTPSEDNSEDIVSLLFDYHLDFPVLVDYKSTIYNSGVIPHDLRFHNFLLNKNRQPVFVGNPFDNTRLKELFIRVCRNYSTQTTE